MGREEALDRLHQLLQEERRVAIAAVAGMGGVGKTELAIRYALAQKQSYSGGICWVSARSGGDIGIQIVRFAKAMLDLKPAEELDVETQVRFCWQHWPEGEVLLVLDDVTDYAKVKPYLPTEASRFKILLTTRLHLGASIGQLSLDVLQPEAALKLLESLIGEERLQQEIQLARDLCKQLGYLPLGLELVGRYLKRKTELTLAEMLTRLENKRLEHLSLKKHKSEDDMTAPLGVQEAFELSWQALDETAKQLGCLLSLFALAPISWSLVEQCWPDMDLEELEEIRDYGLLNLHLLQEKGKGFYQLHQLIREFLQEKMAVSAQADEQKRAFCQAMVVIAKQIPYSPTRQQLRLVSHAVPHLAEAAKGLSQFLNDEDLYLPFAASAKFYEGQGLYTLAEPWYEQCLSAVKTRFGNEHLAVATSLNNLALLYYSQGRYSEAEALYKQALELTQRLLGDEHLAVATSLNNLASLYYFQGRYSEAKPLLVQALELSQRLVGNEHPDTATSLNNLAGLYESQGCYSEAEPLYKQALELAQRLLGNEHPIVAGHLNNLAGLYHSQGRYSEAEPLYKQALELAQRLLGNEHPDVASSLNNLASLYSSQDRYSEAEGMHKEALKLRQRLLGDEHPDVAQSLSNLALLYYFQCRYSEAEPLLVQALKLRQRLLGDEHPDMAISLNNLALLYKSQGHYREAEPLYKQALQIAERVLGVDHLSTVLYRRNLKSLRDAIQQEPNA
ncbi:tetratricopeptide repeat protein [Leptolyngbya sp. FACHB-261]|nr:tetratricopeptide repeat protein [Leptolyngbya sp. FACHB-261]